MTENCSHNVKYDLITVYTETSNTLGRLDVVENAVFKCINKTRLFRGLSLRLLMVLIGGLDSRLLTSLSLWLGSIVARLTC